MANIWLASTGNDNNNGSTEELAVQTMGKAIGLAGAGGTIYLVDEITSVMTQQSNYQYAVYTTSAINIIGVNPGISAIKLGTSSAGRRGVIQANGFYGRDLILDDTNGINDIWSGIAGSSNSTSADQIYDNCAIIIPDGYPLLQASGNTTGNVNGGNYTFNNCSIKGNFTISSSVTTTKLKFNNCAFARSSSTNYGLYTNSLYSAIFDSNWKLSVFNARYGVYSGLYPWLKRTNYYIKSDGVYYRDNDDDALEMVETLEEENGLEYNLSPAVMELIRALDNPQIVGFNVDTLVYKAIHIDDMQLMIPTGDIDLSLASKVNSFVFNDVGDVRRLLSVDNGATWRCFDGSEFIEFEGDITDKEAVYAVANDTDTLNSLTAEQIAEIIPPANVDKHIRFLTVLKQAALADDTRTLSVGIDNERRGYFKSISTANFEETLFTGSLQIKYIGADNISELHLLLAV
jgi:hypothetical protein